MSPQANYVSSPSPRRAPIRTPFTYARRARLRRKDRDKAKEPVEDPIPLPLLRPPRSKAIAPYTPRNDLEDRSIRFLIYHCTYRPSICRLAD
jgi:hypothetical protein